MRTQASDTLELPRSALVVTNTCALKQYIKEDVRYYALTVQTSLKYVCAHSCLPSSLFSLLKCLARSRPSHRVKLKAHL
jgi:hypothetical protein